jgi:hypothetical protein
MRASRGAPASVVVPDSVGVVVPSVGDPPAPMSGPPESGTVGTGANAESRYATLPSPGCNVTPPSCDVPSGQRKRAFTEVSTPPDGEEYTKAVCRPETKQAPLGRHRSRSESPGSGRDPRL